MSHITEAQKEQSFPRYIAMWIGQALSLLGTQVVQFAIIWWLTITTESATVLAIASLFGMLPNLIIGPFVGPLVDRWNRRLTMLVADGTVALITLGLAILFFADLVEPWHVYAALFLRSAIGSFHAPAMNASTALMVPERHLTRVQGFNQILNGGLNIVAAPIAAALLAFMSIGQMVLIDVVTALFAILPLLFIAVPQPPKKLEQSGDMVRDYFNDLAGGFRYVWRWTGLMILMGMVAMVNLLISPAMSLLPLHVTQHFGGGEWELATLQAAFSVGVIVGGLLLGAWGGFTRKMHTSLMGLAGLGAGVILLGLLPTNGFWVAVGGMAFGGIAIAMTNGPIMAVFQAVIAPEVQGRVFNLTGALSTGMIPLGMIMAGPLADRFGTNVWFLAAGGACLTVAIISLFVPAVMSLEDYRPEVVEDAAPAQA